jgi:hypothetical protein
MGACALLEFANASGAQDAYLGDWQGTLQLAGGSHRSVAVQMIPHGNGRYEAKFLPEFNVRLPALHHLRGEFIGGQFQFVDAMPFEAGRVLRATEDGLVVAASLWSGKLAGQALGGNIVGRERGEFKLVKVERLSPTLGKRPPVGAVVLFDGSDLQQWMPRDPNKTRVEWKLVGDGSMEVRGGDIVSKEKFRDHRLHLEFRTPYMPGARGQGRGNSGVYLQGRYEVQVLDSYGLEGEDNECGGIYRVAKPLVNMCAPPLQWQTYDVEYRAVRFDPSGQRRLNARITVVHNGVKIHDNVELPVVTGGAFNDNEGEPAGLMLQDHGNPVRFRNIWIERLD